MDQATHEVILEKVDELIQMLSEHEDECYIPLEVAHQLRDEVLAITPEETDEE